MTISRRDALKTLAAVPLFGLEDPSLPPNRRKLTQVGDATLRAIADVVLPSEADRKAAVHAFTAWIANYKEGADTDHGYGNTRVRRDRARRPRATMPRRSRRSTPRRVAKGAASFAAATARAAPRDRRSGDRRREGRAPSGPSHRRAHRHRPDGALLQFLGRERSLLPRRDRPRRLPRAARLRAFHPGALPPKGGSYSARLDDDPRIRRLHHRRRHLGGDARARSCPS